MREVLEREWNLKGRVWRYDELSRKFRRGGGKGQISGVSGLHWGPGEGVLGWREVMTGTYNFSLTHHESITCRIKVRRKL